MKNWKIQKSKAKRPGKADTVDSAPSDLEKMGDVPSAGMSENGDIQPVEKRRVPEYFRIDHPDKIAMHPLLHAKTVRVFLDLETGHIHALRTIKNVDMPIEPWRDENGLIPWQGSALNIARAAAAQDTGFGLLHLLTGAFQPLKALPEPSLPPEEMVEMAPPQFAWSDPDVQEQQVDEQVG